MKKFYSKIVRVWDNKTSVSCHQSNKYLLIHILFIDDLHKLLDTNIGCYPF